MKKIMRLMLMAGFLLPLTVRSLWADNPETDRSAANFDNKETGALQHTKDGANRALNRVDSEVHKTGRKVKSGARKAKKKTNGALIGVDKGVHKTGHEASDAGNHALDKVDDTVHGRN